MIKKVFFVKLDFLYKSTKCPKCWQLAKWSIDDVYIVSLTFILFKENCQVSGGSTTDFVNIKDFIDFVYLRNPSFDLELRNRLLPSSYFKVAKSYVLSAIIFRFWENILSCQSHHLTINKLFRIQHCKKGWGRASLVVCWINLSESANVCT